MARHAVCAGVLPCLGVTSQETHLLSALTPSRRRQAWTADSPQPAASAEQAGRGLAGQDDQEGAWRQADLPTNTASCCGHTPEQPSSLGRPDGRKTAGALTVFSTAHQHIIVGVQEQALVGGLPAGGSQVQVVEGAALAVVAQALLLVQGHAHESGQHGPVRSACVQGHAWVRWDRVGACS